MSLSFITPNTQERRSYDQVCRVLEKNRREISMFNVNMAYMPHVRTRVKLARRLRTEVDKNSRDSSTHDWFVRQAAAADILLDEDTMDVDIRDVVSRRRGMSKEQLLRAELADLLESPLTGRGISGSRKYAHGR